MLQEDIEDQRLTSFLSTSAVPFNLKIIIIFYQENKCKQEKQYVKSSQNQRQVKLALSVPIKTQK